MSQYPPTESSGPDVPLKPAAKPLSVPRTRHRDDHGCIEAISGPRWQLHPRSVQNLSTGGGIDVLIQDRVVTPAQQQHRYGLGVPETAAGSEVKTPTQALPLAPPDSVPPFMPKRAVRYPGQRPSRRPAAHEAATGPGGQNAAQRFQPYHRVPSKKPVIKLSVTAADEHIDAICAPRHCAWVCCEAPPVASSRSRPSHSRCSDTGRCPFRRKNASILVRPDDASGAEVSTPPSDCQIGGAGEYVKRSEAFIALALQPLSQLHARCWIQLGYRRDLRGAVHCESAPARAKS